MGGQVGGDTGGRKGSLKTPMEIVEDDAEK